MMTMGVGQQFQLGDRAEWPAVLRRSVLAGDALWRCAAGILTRVINRAHCGDRLAAGIIEPGEIAYSHTKITAVPGFEARTNIRGQGPIPVADTPHGRIVSPICYDLDFPHLIRQVGNSKAELMLVPASD